VIGGCESVSLKVCPPRSFKNRRWTPVKSDNSVLKREPIIVRITRSNTRADDRATRAILNHALIKFRRRFFPQSNHACPCGHNRLETRAHILTYPHDLDYDDARVPFAPQKNPEKIMGILLLCIRASATKLSSDSGQVN